MMQGFNKKILPVMKDTAQAAADITAEMVNKVATTVGGGSMTRVTVATGDLGTSVANLKDATNKEAENIAKRSENIDKNIENQSALQGDVTSLIDTLKQNKEMKVNLTLDSGKLSDKLFAIQEEKNGGNITFVTEK